MTFEEFFSLIRGRHIGDYFSKSYWRRVYQRDLEETSESYILHELPFIAVHVVADEYLYKGLL